MTETPDGSRTASRSAPGRSRASGLLLWSLWVAYVLVRTAMLPADLSETPSFTHDSGYIGIVARNLVAGRGYVNDVNWLLFLNPPALPMYFHNANPLYPTLAAGIMRLTGWDPARSAGVLSIIGSALIGLGVYWLVRRFHPSGKLAIAGAVLAIVFPANWRISFSIMPDALATGVTMCLLALVVYAARWWQWVLAGLLFGASWLTRSSATLVVPVVALWMVRRRGLTRGLTGGVLIGAASLIVATPWLVHTARVRGGPLVSDASYYWLMDYHAAHTNRGVDQYFRSMEPPPSGATVLRTDPAGLLSFGLRGAGTTVKRALGGLAEWDKVAALALLLALGAGAMSLAKSALSLEVVAGALVWLLTVAALAVRGPSVEARYFSVGNTFLCLLLLVPFATTLTGWRRWLRAPIAVYVAVTLVPQDLRLTRFMLTPDSSLAGFRAYAQEVARTMPDSSAAVSHLPYLFAYHTGRRAVSPPYPGKPLLLEVMGRYHASVVMLPTDSLGYFYPGSPAALAPDLRLDRQLGRFTVLRLPPPSE